MAFFFASRAAAKAARKVSPGQERLNQVYFERSRREKAERDHFAEQAEIAEYERGFGG